jgi:hypothetical protein
MRVAWYDEVCGPGAYEEEQENGWAPPGAYYYKSAIKIRGEIKDLHEVGTIPFNTKGLMFIEHWVDQDQNQIWYQVIWEDRTVWILKDWLVLTHPVDP